MSDFHEIVATSAELAGLIDPDLGHVTAVHDEILAAIRILCPGELGSATWRVEPVFADPDTLLGLSLIEAPHTETARILPTAQSDESRKLRFSGGKIDVPGQVFLDAMQQVFTDSPSAVESNWRESGKYRDYLTSYRNAKEALAKISFRLSDIF